MFLRPVLPQDYSLLYVEETAGALGPRWRFGGQTPSFEQYVSSLWGGVLAQFLVIDRRSMQPSGIVAAYNADLPSGFAFLSVAGFSPVRPDPDSIVVQGAALFIDYCFSTWPLRRMYAETNSYISADFEMGLVPNFVEVARIPNHVLIAGEHWDRVTYMMERDAWVRLHDRYGPVLRSEPTRAKHDSPSFEFTEFAEMIAAHFELKVDDIQPDIRLIGDGGFDSLGVLELEVLLQDLEPASGILGRMPLAEMTFGDIHYAYEQHRHHRINS